jgi:hypothetical protein
MGRLHCISANANKGAEWSHRQVVVTASCRLKLNSTALVDAFKGSCHLGLNHNRIHYITPFASAIYLMLAKAPFAFPTTTLVPELWKPSHVL